MFESVVISSFGGGLDLRPNPLALRDDQWSWSDGWLARDGYAETWPGYTAVAFVGTGTQQIIGMLPNPFTNDGAVVITVDDVATARVFTVTGNGVVTAIPSSAGDPVGTKSCAPIGAFINGFLTASAGAVNILTGSTFRWNGGAVINPLGPNADFLIGFGSHAIMAAGTPFGATTSPITQAALRQVAWSASNDESNYTPAVSNDADFAVLDDLSSGITALMQISPSAVGVFTRDTISVLSPTGGIPAFTRQPLIDGIGCRQLRNRTFGTTPATNRRHSFYGKSPYGVFFWGADNLYLITGGLPEPVGAPIFPYWSRNILPVMDTSLEYGKPFVWHAQVGAMICPRPIAAIADKAEGLWFHARTQAWSRIVWRDSLVNDPALRHAFIYDYNIAGTTHQAKHWFAAQNFIFREEPTAIRTGIFVDTKDFAFSDPMDDDYVDRIKVDWEPLTNAATDALQVSAAARNDLSLGILGSPGLETQALTFTSLGTLTGGDTELPVRLRGRYTRFRFTATSGQMRIRGFSIRRERAGDRSG